METETNHIFRIKDIHSSLKWSFLETLCVLGSQDEDFEDMIAQAETMENQYGRLFDKVIVNGDVATALRELKGDLEKTEEEDVRWIPAEWIRSSERRSCGHLSSWI